MAARSNRIVLRKGDPMLKIRAENWLKYSVKNPVVYDDYVYKLPNTFDLCAYEGKVFITDDKIYYFELRYLQEKISQELRAQGPGTFKITLSKWGFIFELEDNNPNLGYVDI